MSGMKGSEGVSNVGSNGIFRRSPPLNAWYRLPRRYVVALLCYIAFVIREWMIMNLNMLFYHLFTLGKDERLLHFPKIAEWSPKEVESMLYSYYWANAVSQIPSAFLAMSFPPYRIMGISLFLSYVLHAMIPLTLHHSSTGAIVLLFSLGILTSPLDTSCIALWREWAPSTERNRLVLLAFSGQYIHVQVLLPLVSYLSDTVGPNSIYYFAGIAGILWCVLWFSLMSDCPENDPLISEAELLYLEDNVPAQNKEKVIVRSIPVRSILTSGPTLSLCLVFFSSSFSSRSMIVFIMMQMIGSEFEVGWLQWTMAANCMLVIPAAGFLIDFLINRKTVRTTMMKKILCSGALVIHAFFMFMLFVPQHMVKVVSATITYLALPFAMAGALPNILDISPRYSCALMGLAMTAYCASEIVFDFLIPPWITFDEGHLDKLVTYLPAGMLALIAAVLYGLFGSGDEQVWSCPPLPMQRRGNDGQYYPRRNSADNEVLVTGNV